MGDIDGDGFDDILITAPFGSSSGEAFLVFGAYSVGTNGVLDVTALNGGPGFVINGITSGDSMYAAGSAGDVNGDGSPDIILGSAFADPGSPARGAAGQGYIVFGGSGVGTGGSVDLSTLNGTNGYILNGIDSNDKSGKRVSGAGDINGDGFADIIIGADRAAPNGLSQAGESYVVFGGPGLATLDGLDGTTDGTIELSNLNGTTSFTINGADSSDRAGISVSAAGDFNGDGIDDLIVGAYSNTPGASATTSNAGASYVIFGRDVAVEGNFAASLDLTSLNGFNGVRLDGIDSNDKSGISVSGAGDVNGDGTTDLIIGAYSADPNPTDAGESYVIFGSSTFTSSTLPQVFLGSLEGSTGFTVNGIDGNDESGTAVSGAGDVNGDGFDDFLIGARRADQPSNSDAGESYIVFGSASVGANGSINLSDLDGTNGFVLNGIDAGDFSGGAVAAAGDVNGDGFADFIIGAQNGDGANNGVNGAGESYLVFGSANVGSSGSINLSGLSGSDGVLLLGILGGDTSGRWVDGGGDVNGDGLADLLIGADGADPNDSSSGEAYVVFGAASLGTNGTFTLSSLDGTNGFIFNGITGGDRVGRSVRFVGDFNGDGVDDLIIGARSGDPPGQTDAGESYVVFGGTSNLNALDSADTAANGIIELSNLNGTTGFVLNGIVAGDESGYSVAGAGDVNGDGFADLIIGARKAESGHR